MSARKPTAEQSLIIEAAKELLQSHKYPVLVIEAGAGTGKTTTLRMIADILNEDGQYTAFNKSLVTESAEKFQGTKVTCNTTHSLAFRSEGKKYSKRLGGTRIKSYEVAAILGISLLKVEVAKNDAEPVEKILSASFLAGQVLKALARFCQSDDPEITTQHFKYIDGIDLHSKFENNQKVRDYLLPFAQAAWLDILNVKGKLPFSHDYYVKIWQLNNPAIFGAYVLLDEGQDTAPVMLDVLKQLDIPVIIVGDSAQQIYEWRGAVNALAAFPGAPVLYLSQSFRFGEVVANIANVILSHLEEPTKLKLKGLSTIPTKVERIADPDVILCRTNAVAVSNLLEGIKQGKKPHLIGGGSDVVSFVEAAAALQRGEPTQHQDLACFTSWTEVQEYAKLDEGDDLKLMVKLVDTFSTKDILAGLKGMADEKSADLVLCTAHKSKGREWNKVKLASDFPPANKMNDSDKRLLYVAVTRAKLVLDIYSCPPLSPLSKEEERFDISFAVSSAKIEEKPAEEVAAETTVTIETPPTPKAEEKFTWSNWKDQWLVRGPRGFAGKTVVVERKNGSKQSKQLGAVVVEFTDSTLYATS